MRVLRYFAFAESALLFGVVYVLGVCFGNWIHGWEYSIEDCFEWEEPEEVQTLDLIVFLLLSPYFLFMCILWQKRFFGVCPVVSYGEVQIFAPPPWFKGEKYLPVLYNNSSLSLVVALSWLESKWIWSLFREHWA